MTLDAEVTELLPACRLLGNEACGSFFGSALLRLHRRTVVQNKLPTPVAPHEDVRKSERHLAELTLVRAFQILHAGHDRRVAVRGNFHVHVLNEFWLDSVLVSSPDPVE